MFSHPLRAALWYARSMTEINLTRTRQVFTLPTNMSLQKAAQLSFNAQAGQVVRVNWSALLVSALQTSSLVSYTLKETSDPSNLELADDNILNFTSYTSIAAGARIPVTGAAPFVAQRNGVHNLLVVMAGYVQGDPSKSIGLNAVELYAEVS